MKMDTTNCDICLQSLPKAGFQKAHENQWIITLKQSKDWKSNLKKIKNIEKYVWSILAHEFLKSSEFTQKQLLQKEEEAKLQFCI